MNTLTYTYRHKDGARLIVIVARGVTRETAEMLRLPTDDQSYMLLSSSRLVSYYFDWEHESTTYADAHGDLTIWAKTGGGK